MPGLAETVLAGNTDAYVDWFLRAGTHERRGVDAELRAAFLAAYRDPETLRAGFDHYRALPGNVALVAAAARRPLAQPVLALGGSVVGDALARQLAPITDDLTSALLPAAGHILPADAPGPLAARLRAFVEERPDA